MKSSLSAGLLEELEWRGLLYQHTEGLADALAAGPVSAYAGFDPTAPSLHVGNLIPVMGLAHLQRAGHRPIVLIGGGTGMIGDPSGKASERQLNSLEVVAANAAAIRTQLERFLDFTGPAAARMDDNADWLLQMRAVDFMRDVGKHFTLNYMLSKESVSARLQTGISYTEFSYMLLQAYDFLQLHHRYGVTLQIGGSDQWGNITSGIELIRRTAGAAAHGFTLPLVTTASGTKFGKTEAGSVWLDPGRTSPYRFYQFWINTDDRDAARYLKFFTLLQREEITALESAVEQRPEGREAQTRLAAEVTRMVHGEDAARTADEVSRVLFSGGDPRSLSRAAHEALHHEVPSLDAKRAEALGSATPPTDSACADAIRLLVDGSVVNSGSAARRLIEQGGVYVNGQRITMEQRFVDSGQLLHGEYLLVSKGARQHLHVRIKS